MKHEDTVKEAFPSQMGTKPSVPKGEARSAIVVLQFFVGGLVTMGGALFATLAVNPFGTGLGLVHLSISVTCLLAGITFLQGKSWSRSVLLIINPVAIGYSCLLYTSPSPR